MTGLGAVSVDVHKREREWKNLTLSDSEVVKYLILYRSKVDVVYSSNININIGEAGDVFDFNQELITLYTSLDKVIEQCNFKEKNAKLLELLFEGNTLQDIVKMNIGYKSSATYDLLDRMVVKIVSINNKNWKETMKKNGYVK